MLQPLCESRRTEKFWKRWEYQITWPASWEICMQVKKQQLEADMEQQTGSKLGKERVKAIYLQTFKIAGGNSPNKEKRLDLDVQ